MAKKEKERGRCALDLPRVSYLRAAEGGEKGPDKIKINQKKRGGAQNTTPPAPTWPRPQQKRKRGQGHQQPPAATRAEVENFPWALRPLAPDFRRAGGGRVSWVRGGGGSTKGVQKNGGRRKGRGEWGTSWKGGERRQPTDNNNKKGLGEKNYSIRTSHVLTNRTTNRTRTCLTSLSGREAVLSD